MKRILLAALLVSACASHSVRAPFIPPASAASHEELIKAIPQDLFRGDIAGDNRASGTDSGEFLDFVFLKNDADDMIPMRVALYTKVAGRLELQFVSPTPFAPGDCRRGECRARISTMVYGFQLSRESLAADQLRADYRFVREGKDLKLTGKGFQVPKPGDGKGKGHSCSIFYDYERGRILRAVGEEKFKEPLVVVKAPHLLADHLRFETPTPETLCHPAPVTPPN